MKTEPRPIGAGLRLSRDRYSQFQLTLGNMIDVNTVISYSQNTMKDEKCNFYLDDFNKSFDVLLRKASR